MSIFKACDVRGLYPDEIDEKRVYRIGRAIGTVLDSKTVVVGGDVRLSTPSLKRALIDGLTFSSCDVINLGAIPTPAFYFAKSRLGADAGVMVTASHNPPDFNGLKIVLGDLPITEQQLARIRGLSESNWFLTRRKRSRRVGILADYIDFILGEGRRLLDVGPSRPRRCSFPVKVAIDCGNGCYSKIAPMVFGKLGINHAPLFCQVDGSFPNRSPDSAVARNLETLQGLVVSEQAGLGIAFDGDGDRVGFVDETGKVLPADKALAIMVRYADGGIAAAEKVVIDIKCSSAAAEVVRSMGATPLVEKSGHTFIKTRMITEEAVLGGEMSGHFFHRRLGGGDDGLYSALLMTAISARHGPLSALAAEIPSYATTPDLRIRAAPDPALIETIAEAFPASMVSRHDGVKVVFEDGWGLARLSVTEPVITLRFEGRDESALRRIMDDFLSPTPDLKRMVLHAGGGIE